MATKYEEQATFNAGYQIIPGYYWTHTHFTSAASGHRIASIKLQLSRYDYNGSGTNTNPLPGILTVAISADDGATTLCSGTYNCNSLTVSADADDLVEIIFTSPVTLAGSTAYYIVYKLPTGDYYNDVIVGVDSGGAFAAETGDRTIQKIPAFFEIWDNITYSAIACPVIGATAKVLLPSTIRYGINISAVSAAATIGQCSTPFWQTTIMTAPDPGATVGACKTPHLSTGIEHGIISGLYSPDSGPLPDVVLVMGRDREYGNLIFSRKTVTQTGSHNFIQMAETAITNQTDADTIGENVLAIARIHKNTGRIEIPPHFGMELWDVIEIYDTPANQSASKYRVMGFTRSWDKVNGRYVQYVELTAV